MLTKIKIKQLFHKHDITIDLSKKCVVIIGANGIGKTAALKILKNLMCGNFVELLAVPFESLALENVSYLPFESQSFSAEKKTGTQKGNQAGINETQREKRVEKFSVSYKDCLMPKNLLFKRFENEDISEYLQDEFESFVEDLIQKDLYAQFLYATYKKKEYPFAIKRLFKSDMPFGSGVIDMESEFQEMVPVNVERTDLVLAPELLYSDATEYIAFEGAPILKKKAFRQMIGIQRDVFYFNLVDNYSIVNDLILEPVIQDEEKNWAYSNPNLGTYGNLKRIIDTMGYSKDSLGKYRKALTNSGFLDLEDSYTQDLNEIEKALVTEHKLYLGKLINRVYYLDEALEKINALATKYAKEFYEKADDGLEWEREEMCARAKKCNEKLTEELREHYLLYIRPALIRHSLFDVNMEEDIPSSKYNISAFPEYMTELDLGEPPFSTIGFTGDDDGLPFSGDDSFMNIKGGFEGFPFDQEIEPFRNFFSEPDPLGREEGEILFRECFLQFVEEAYRLISDPAFVNEKVLRFGEILQKYFMGKRVRVTPAGLILQNSEDSQHIHFSLYDGKNLDLTMLSSGERKLVILFAVGIFFNKYIMLDEPELSLSLVWQESLLPDLVHECGDGLIVATHSPFMVSDESMKKYLQYLP